jgi:hypothetical protein
MNRTILLFLLLSLASLACSAVTNLVAPPTPVPSSTPRPRDTPRPTLSPTLSPTPDSILLDETEFDDASCFKQMQSDAEVERFVESGQFHIHVKTADLSAWEFCEKLPFDDFVVEADATQLNGPDSNGYGLILRSTGNQFYLFLVGGDGYYSFIHYGLESDPNFIVDWTESDAINQGNQTNHLRVVAVASHFEFYINDELVGEADDERLSSGDVGFFVLSSDQNGLDVAFDNLKVTAP